MKKVLFAILTLMLSSQLAFGAAEYNSCFFSMEKSGDDLVSKSEFLAKYPEGADVFAAADANGDGTLDHDEWEGYKESQGIEDNHDEG